MVVIFDRAIRAGLKIERIGELVFPTYKRAHPELFVEATALDGFALLERGYREDTTYGGVDDAELAQARQAAAVGELLRRLLGGEAGDQLGGGDDALVDQA